MKKLILMIMAIALGVTAVPTNEAEAGGSRQGVSRRQQREQRRRELQRRKAHKIRKARKAVRQQQQVGKARKLRVRPGPAARLEAIHCRFEPVGRPMAYVRYEPSSRTVWTQTGWPQQWRSYQDVEVLTGLPPYGNQGFTLVAFGDVPILHVRMTGNAHTWYERHTSFPYEAAWGLVPTGVKIKETRGVCWTNGNGPVMNESEGLR